MIVPAQPSREVAACSSNSVWTNRSGVVGGKCQASGQVLPHSAGIGT